MIAENGHPAGAGGQPVLVVLRALKLGDFLTGAPALRALARAFPDYDRALAAPRYFEPLAAQVGCRIVDTPDLGPLDGSLTGPDIAVDLHGRGPKSQEVLLDLNPRRLISFAHPAVPETAGSPVWRPDEHEIARWCRMLAESGIPSRHVDPTDLRIEVPAGAEAAWAKGATLVHPGAASQARRWPADRFAEVARWEAAAGRPVFVTGTAAERRLAFEVADRAGLPPGAVVAGRTGLGELIAAVAAAGRVVCGDTGIAHVATAVGTPSVVLFGPIPPAEWGPPPLDRHIALWAGRRGDPHGDVTDEGLLLIGVKEVLAALERLPRGGG